MFDDKTLGSPVIATILLDNLGAIYLLKLVRYCSFKGTRQSFRIIKYVDMSVETRVGLQ